MVLSQGVEVTVEFGIGISFITLKMVFLEESETLVIAHFLSGLDKRLTLGKSPAQYAHSLPGLSHTLELGSCPGILVVVGGEAQPVGR